MSLKKPKSNLSSTKLKKLRKPVIKAQPIARKAESEESDSSENILSDDENQWKDTKRITDQTPDYHNIQKLVKYVKAGNTTATIVSLCCLKDYDLSISTNQLVRIFFLLNIFVGFNLSSMEFYLHT